MSRKPTQDSRIIEAVRLGLFKRSSDAAMFSLAKQDAGFAATVAPVQCRPGQVGYGYRWSVSWDRPVAQ